MTATPLPGGTANAGRVVRIGDTVRRPRGSHTEAVHALLGHLAERGFDGAPDVVALQPAHEVLTYVEGTAAVDPVPQWALDDEVLPGVGALLRRFHDATAGFDGSQLRWQRVVPARWRARRPGHNDVNPANVIFRDARAVALIDFDLAAPAAPAFDLAVAACFWAPLRADADVPDSLADRRMHRLGILLDGYGANAALRDATAVALGDANGWITDVIRDASQRGHPAFGRVWDAQSAMLGRAADWIEAHHRDLAAAAHR